MKLRLSRILHAGYLMSVGETHIAFDPIFENPFSQNCFAYPQVKFDLAEIKNLKLSAVFISHFHDDHFSLESLVHLDVNTPIYAFCLFDELFQMIRALGFTKVYSLELNSPVQVGELRVTPLEALDSDVDSIFFIEACGLNILNLVDSWIGEKTMKILSLVKEWHLIMWPFQTMREIEVLSPKRASPADRKLPQEWMEQIKILRPRFIIPSSCQFIQESWSWYRDSYFPISYAQFSTEVESYCEVLRMDPGRSVVVDRSSVCEIDPLSWVKPIGNQNVDYAYQDNFSPPKTNLIAQHFLELKSDGARLVHEYCSRELLKKYTRLNPSEFFRAKRIWRLSLFDQRGQEILFHYRIEASNIEICSEQKPDWTTEIAASKLHSALVYGESMSSLYLRINDDFFDESIELALQEADLLEDPLVRCLFESEFGSYQKAQLKKLRPR